LPLITSLVLKLGTGVAQPCETSVNRVLKHLIKSACIEYLAGITQDQLRHEIKAENVVIKTTPQVLRDTSTAWILSAWKWLKEHEETVLNGWCQAKFGGMDLAYESLSNPTICSIVHKRFSDDQQFAFSVATISLQPGDANFEEDPDGPNYDDDYALDPSVLCDICSFSTELPANIVDSHGNLAYTSDEELTDDDADGESDIECMDFES
jgi:hypothetical protein